MSKLSISEASGPTHVTRADGEALRHHIEAHWDDTEPLVLDFEGAVIASVSLFDESFGMFALRYPLPELTRRLRLENISEKDKTLLNRIIASRDRQRAQGTQRGSQAASARGRRSSA